MRKRLRKKLGIILVGEIYQDCNYHPVKCTMSDGYNIEGVSLLDGIGPRSCGIRSCGVFRLTKRQVNKSIESYRKGGERGLLKLSGWTDAEIDKFMKEWRSPRIENDNETLTKEEGGIRS